MNSLGSRALAQRRDALDLGEIRDRQDARHDRHGNSKPPAAIAEPQQIGVVVEQLRDDDRAAGIDFALEIIEIGLGADCLLMRFRIAGDGDAELRKFAADQCDELVGVAESAGHGLERRVSLRRIAAQGDDVLHALFGSLGQIRSQLDRRSNRRTSDARRPCSRSAGELR